MRDLSHLNALQTRLEHERATLALSKSDFERTLRAVWVKQIEKEIDAEMRFLDRSRGLSDAPLPAMTDDELLAQLGS